MKLRPSTHFLMVGALMLISAAGYAAVIWSGTLRGYQPSVLIAMRDLSYYVLAMAAIVWLLKSRKFKGDLTLLTAALVLFTVGNVVQYRLFSDPEYGARGTERYAARSAKMQVIRERNIATAYDDEKKKALYGVTETDRLPAADTAVLQRESSFHKLITSEYTYLPILAWLALAGAYWCSRREGWWRTIQRSSVLIGLVTLVPFTILVLLFARSGKFFGGTTPWEPVKVLFLLSYAGMLSESFRGLARTRWGLPPLGFFLPLAAVAALPVLPFFALSDFGQMLVFLLVYAGVYLVAVSRLPQLLLSLALSFLFSPIFYFGFGIPGRVRLRFHLWLHASSPPAPGVEWWQPLFARIQGEYGATVISNTDAWFDQASQVLLGLFGITTGGLLGSGLGLGFPEVVPVSDSDFIYAATAEELGLLGGMVILVALIALVSAGLRTAIESRDMFSKLVAAGLTGFFGFQAIINIGGVTRLLPMTGITLPFVSHGGSSLLTSFAMLGILLAISDRNAKELHRAD